MATPFLMTGFVAYWLPWLHAFDVKKCQPLTLIAGSPLISKVRKMNVRARAGITAPAPPSQRMSWPLRRLVRSAAPSRRGSGAPPAPPSGCTTGAGAVMMSALDLGDLVVGQRDHRSGQRLEVHLRQLRGAAGDRPVQERLDVLRLGRARLRGVHDRVLVVDDRVRLGARAVDE